MFHWRFPHFKVIKQVAMPHSNLFLVFKSLLITCSSEQFLISIVPGSIFDFQLTKLHLKMLYHCSYITCYLLQDDIEFKMLPTLFEWYCRGCRSYLSRILLDCVDSFDNYFAVIATILNFLAMSKLVTPINFFFPKFAKLHKWPIFFWRCPLDYVHHDHVVWVKIISFVM